MHQIERFLGLKLRELSKNYVESDENFLNGELVKIFFILFIEKSFKRPICTVICIVKLIEICENNVKTFKTLNL